MNQELGHSETHLGVVGQQFLQPWYASFFAGPSKMVGMENVVMACYMKELVEEQDKTHKEVADILRQQHPGLNGLSERSVRRFCAMNGIWHYDSRVTGVDVHNVVTSAFAEVIVAALYNIRFR